MSIQFLNKKNNINSDYLNDCLDISKEILGINSSKYTKLEYIQTDGNQYINTGVVSSPDLEFEIKYNNISDGTKDYEVLFGARSRSVEGTSVYLKDAQKRCTFATCGYDSDTQHDYILFTSATYNAGTYLNKDVIVSLRNNKIKIDNGIDFISMDTNIKQIYTKNTLHLFGQYAEDIASGETSNIVDRCKVKLYYFKIYKSDILIRDFIPVKDENNVICLYDTITRKFYYNGGTGNFTGGAEVNG